MLYYTTLDCITLQYITHCNLHVVDFTDHSSCTSVGQWQHTNLRIPNIQSLIMMTYQKICSHSVWIFVIIRSGVLTGTAHISCIVEISLHLYIGQPFEVRHDMVDMDCKIYDRSKYVDDAGKLYRRYAMEEV